MKYVLSAVFAFSASSSFAAVETFCGGIGIEAAGSGWYVHDGKTNPVILNTLDEHGEVMEHSAVMVPALGKLLDTVAGNMDIKNGNCACVTGETRLNNRRGEEAYVYFATVTKVKPVLPSRCAAEGLD